MNFSRLFGFSSEHESSGETISVLRGGKGRKRERVGREMVHGKGGGGLIGIAFTN